MSVVVSKNDYVKASGAARCVDERKDKEGELLGVQMPGGSEHIMDLLLTAVFKSDQDVDEETLFKMTQAVYASDVAQKFGFEPGVHIDDEHGDLSFQDCDDRCFGCGYDKVRGDVLKRMGVEIEYDPGARIQTARDLNWNVQVLTADHVSNATAAINQIESMTLKTSDLLADGRTQSFNYDHWVVTVLKPAMIQVLEDHNLTEAAHLLDKNAEEWGIQLYAETLDILSNGALGEHNLITIA